MLSERRDVGVASTLVQTTRSIGSTIGTALVGIVIAHTSVIKGVQSGVALCVLLVLCSAWLAHQIKIKKRN